MKILVLHSDKSSGLNFVKCLQMAKSRPHEYEIFGTSSNPCRMFLVENDHTIFVDPKTEKDPKAVVEFARKQTGEEFDLVYQAKSAEHMVNFSKHRDSYPTFLPSHEAIETYEDKYATYKHLSALGFPVPETYLIKGKEDVSQAFKQLGKQNVWVRDIAGQGGRGSFASNNVKEVIENIEQCNGWGHFTVSEKLPIDMEHSWEDRLSPQMLPGEMLSWVALYNHGELVAAQARKRLYWEHSDLTVSGVTGYTGANMTLSSKELHKLSDSIVRSFDFPPHGVMGIDFLVNNQGEPCLTEIQASRFFTSTYPLAMLGLNLPRLYLGVFQGENVPMGIVNPCPAGKVYIQRFGAQSQMMDAQEILAVAKCGLLTSHSHPKPEAQPFSTQHFNFES